MFIRSRDGDMTFVILYHFSRFEIFRKAKTRIIVVIFCFGKVFKTKKSCSIILYWLHEKANPF